MCRVKPSKLHGESLIQGAVIRNLEIIGETSHNILVADPDFAASHSELSLAPAYQMRNAIAHGYFQVDLQMVWQTIQRDLPRLKHALLPLIPDA